MFKELLDLEKSINILRNYYYRIQGLFIGYALLISIILEISEKHFSTFIPTVYRIIIYIILSLSWFIVWFISRNYFPKTADNKIGMVIAINAENKKQKTRIKVDFAAKINDLFISNNINYSFDVIVLNDYKSEILSKLLSLYVINKDRVTSKALDKNEAKTINNDIEKWKKVNNKIRSHLYIWGNIKERINQENTYIMNIEALVYHKPIPVEKSNQLKKDFLAIFPREISINEKLEVKGFTFAAELVYLAARFITGNAALISGDPITALNLHDGLINEINRLPKPLPENIIYIARKVESLILMEKSFIATYEYKINKNVLKAKQLILECTTGKNKEYNALCLASIIAFADERNPIDALKYLFQAKSVSGRSYTWLYNRAFIYMYLEKFEKGIKDYKKLVKISYEGEEDNVTECINFNIQLLSSDPSKLQCLFILGFLFYKKKANLPLSLEYFEEFINKINGINKYDYLRTVSLSYLSEIKNLIGI
jgi:hypothetical protein